GTILPAIRRNDLETTPPVDGGGVVHRRPQWPAVSRSTILTTSPAPSSSASLAATALALVRRSGLVTAVVMAAARESAVSFLRDRVAALTPSWSRWRAQKGWSPAGPGMATAGRPARRPAAVVPAPQ